MFRWRLLVGSLLASGAAIALNPGEEYRLPWFMMLVATMGAGYGLMPSIYIAIAIVILDLWLNHHPLASALWILLTLGATAYLSYRARQVLDRMHQEQKEIADQFALLVTALRVLSVIPSRIQILDAIPELLKQQEEHITIWLPEQNGLRLYQSTDNWTADPYEQTAIHRAYRQRSSTYLEEPKIGRKRFALRQQPRSSNLAIPLCEREEVVAILNLRRYQSFQSHEQACFEHFAKTVSNRLSWIAEQAEGQLLNQLSASLASAHSVEGVADRALVLLTSALGMQHGLILQQQGSQMDPIGQYDANEFLGKLWWQDAAVAKNNLVWEVYCTGRPIFIGDLGQEESNLLGDTGLTGSMVVHPIALPDTPRTRVLLCLAHPQPHRWLQSEQELLALACRSVGLALEGAVARKRLETVLDLSGQAALSNSESLYQQVLDSAVELIPGAEAGSLLVRRGERFYFQAAVGYDLESLRNISFTEENHLSWYGGNLEGWRKGEPRILSNDSVSIKDVSAKTASVELGQSVHMERIQANLAVPILYQDEVLALLNLDNFHDIQAFGKDSLEVARFFVTPVATLLHEAYTRRCLEEAALTDSLTSLANRRAFNAYFDEELVRSKRYHQPFALLLLDLHGFKTINDRLGHALGDEALVQVAHALRQERRESDGLFRLGGDEFAALLPQTSAEKAVQVAQRYARAIQAITIQGLSLGANIGVAAYPQDGIVKEVLMRLADERMYAAKDRGISILNKPNVIAH